MRERERFYGVQHKARERDGAVAGVGLGGFQLPLSALIEHIGLADSHGVALYIAVLQRTQLPAPHSTDGAEQDSAAEIRVAAALIQREYIIERRAVQARALFRGQGDVRTKVRQVKRERGGEQAGGVAYGLR